MGQRNGLRSFMKKTKDKQEYHRAQAILKKGEGKTHKEIAKEQETGMLACRNKAIQTERLSHKSLSWFDSTRIEQNRCSS